MTDYSSFSDDYYNTVSLNTELILPSSRESLMHYFEQLRRRFPEMKNFYSREEGEFVLEGDKELGRYRWSSIEPRRISSGIVNPPRLEAALEQHQFVFESIPYILSSSLLDCDMITVMFGFDFTFQGNHSKLLADALGLPSAFDKFHGMPGVTIVGHEPMIQFSLDDEERTLFRIAAEPRAVGPPSKPGEFGDEQLSVYLAVRRYGSLDSEESFEGVAEHLFNQARDLIDNYLIESVLVPLRQTIAIS